MKTLNEFYPTPKELIVKMLAGSNFNGEMSILEPSAGKGAIADHIKACLEARGRRRYSYGCDDNNGYDIDTIELNPEFVHILRGKGHRVVYDDFLTYETQKRYDLIVMNPPFSEGDKHLLKALKLVKDGGRVICLLNAETLKNQCSNYRLSLAGKLEELEAEIEYMSGAFALAERKTDIDVALVKVTIPGEYGSIILDGLKKERMKYGASNKRNDLVHGEFYRGIADMYSFDAEAITRLINEYYSIEPAFKLVRAKKDFYGNISRFEFINGAIRDLRGRYWERFFQSGEISKLLTHNLRQKFYDKLNELKDYDLTLYNIYAMMEEITKSMVQGVEDCIVGLFDELSSRHSYNEYSKNIHYFDGWKTNKAWYINKKVILPLSAFDEWRGSYSYYPTKAENKLSDIEKVFNYLDVGRTESIDIRETLVNAREQGRTQKIGFKFFTVTFYKKGTTHIEFADMELLKKFNIFGSRQKKWLPPSYGNVRYEDMDAGERRVVDSFEGKDEYKKVCDMPEFYLYSASQVQLLAQKPE